MSYEFEMFVENSNRVKSRKELFDLYLDAVGHFGFDRAIYTFITDHDSIGEKAGHGILCNYPDDWMDFYFENGYERLDPVQHHVKLYSKSFTWEALRCMPVEKPALAVLDEAEEAGLFDGVAVPIYNARCEIAGMGLARSAREEIPDRKTLSSLQAITRQFHECYCDLADVRDRAEVPRLTKRQVEVLKWWAIDKTAHEIGIIMNISENTVNYHKKEIYRRLKTNSRILSVVKAIRLGIIPLDRIVV